MAVKRGRRGNFKMTRPAHPPDGRVAAASCAEPIRSTGEVAAPEGRGGQVSRDSPDRYPGRAPQECFMGRDLSGLQARPRCASKGLGSACGSLLPPLSLAAQRGGAGPRGDWSLARSAECGLGRRLISLDPDACGKVLDGGEVGVGSLVVAGGEASGMLELSEEALDEVAGTVELAAEGEYLLTVAPGGNVCGGALRRDLPAEDVAALSARKVLPAGTACSSGSACRQSLAWPSERRSPIGSPRPSTSAWILVVVRSHDELGL